MQHAIVPYQPPSGCSTRAGHQRSFATFVQNGGRVNPIPLGATQDDLESPSIIDGKKESSEAIQIMRATHRQAKATQFAVVIALIFSICVFGGLGIVVWRVNENMKSVEAAIRPHATHMINATLDMMTDMGSSFHNMHEISDYSTEVAASAGGSAGTLTQSLNNTAVITSRLAAFLAHPTLKLSLGDT